jgi:hypothetical protein
MFENQFKVRLLPLFYKLQLVESSNSLVSLVSTRREHQLPECSNTDWMEAPTSTYTSTNLFERTNSLVSLAPTRRKHQLPECSSTDWMEPPTSTYTRTNLHIENSMFSQAPPCHPVFYPQLDGSHNSQYSSTNLNITGPQSSLVPPYLPDYK